MTQTPEEIAAQSIVEQMKSEESFDLADALDGVSYPTEDVTVYLDGAKAHELNLVLDMIAELEIKSENESAAKNGTIADDPAKEQTDKDIEALKAREVVLISEITSSALTFKLRGVAPEVWRIIDKEARRKIKPDTKSEDDQLEAQIERNKYVNVHLLSKGTVQITNAKGQTDKRALKPDDAQKLFDRLIEPEFLKLKDAISNLTFAHTLFQNVAMQDADFLSKS